LNDPSIISAACAAYSNIILRTSSRILLPVGAGSSESLSPGEAGAAAMTIYSVRLHIVIVSDEENWKFDLGGINSSPFAEYISARFQQRIVMTGKRKLITSKPEFFEMASKNVANAD
jgi:hypothetical protein